LSESQEADNFVQGIMRGLMVGTQAKGIGIVAVKDDHVMLQRVAGTIMPNTRISLGPLSQVFDTVAAAQQIERGRLMPDADMAMALGETGTRGITLAQVLSFQAGDPSLVRRAVEKASGSAANDYVMRRDPTAAGHERIACARRWNRNDAAGYGTPRRRPGARRSL
jgi:CubicO group peptidase (beta-lactamase class C family)